MWHMQQYSEIVMRGDYLMKCVYEWCLLGCGTEDGVWRLSLTHKGAPREPQLVG